MSPGGIVTDRALVDRFITTRSETSFLPLFNAFYPKVHRYFAAHGLAAGICEELAQDVMFTVYRQAGQLRDPALFFGWLFKIARNAMLQHLRRGHVEWQLIQDVPPVEFAPEALRNSQLESWVSDLDEQSRQIILLRFVEELTYQEIAEALDIPIGTVKWRLFNAKAKLQELLANVPRKT